MKIKSLLLLGLLAVGMNAFAVDYKVNGIIYNIHTAATASAPGKAHVKGVSAGMADATTITIPANFTDGDGNNILVDGFDAGWENLGGEKNLTSAVKNLNVNVTNIGDLAANSFQNLNILEKVVLSGTVAGADVTVNALSKTTPVASFKTLDLSGLAGKTKVTIAAVDQTIENITLPTQATVIGANAFKGSNLKAIDLTSVTEIGNSAFENCASTDFKSLKITGNIADTKIGTNAFKGMTNLETLIIENNKLKKISPWFDNDAKIKSITITSSSIEEIEDNVFDDITSTDFKAIDLTGCSKLKTVYTSSFSNTLGYEKVLLKGTAIDDANLVKVKSWLGGAGGSLKEITFPDGVTTIPQMGAMTKVESVGLPKNLTTIGAQAFQGWAKLKGIKIKSHITTIGNQAFDGCGDLVRVDFSDATELTTIGANAFTGINADYKTIDLTACAKLNTIQNNSFPQNAYTSVLLAGSGLVYYATPGNPATYTDNFSTPFNSTNILKNATASLTEITLPTELKTVVASQFENFTKLESVSLPKAVETIGNAAFKGSGLTSIKIRENVKTIDTDAFKNCADLATVNFSEATALETIGTSAFENDNKLATIAFPAKLKEIKNFAFSIAGTTPAGLETIDFSQAAELTTLGTNTFNNTKITVIDLSGCAKLNSIQATTFPANKYTSVKLGGTLLAGRNALDVYYDITNLINLQNATESLAEVTLPVGLESVPADFFGEARYAAALGVTKAPFKALTSVSLPKAVKDIKARAFQGSALTAVKIRENVTAIGAAAFQDCADLAIVNFTEATALTTIGGSAFRNSGIKEAILPASVKTMLGGFQFADCAKLKSFSAKGLVGDLPNNILQNCVKLTGVVIPTGATGIGAGAFLGCSTLATVTFKFEAADDALATNGIGARAFEGCEALAALDLSTTKLAALDQADVFKGCTALAEITFPETLTALGDGAGTADGLFAACPIENLDASNVILSDNLFGMYYDANLDANFARNAKNANTTLKTVKISGVVPANCFAYCTALESVEYFEQAAYGWSDVAANAFEHCTGLKTFTFNPEAAVTAQIVDDDAFHGCIPFVKFVTNGYYLDYLSGFNGCTAPLNATFGDAGVTKIQTVQDKKNPNQFFAKFYHTVRVVFNAEDCKVFTAYADGETVYYQACRTYDGYYHIPANRPVIIKTSEAKEVTYEIGGWQNSLGWNDLYCSQEGEDLASVQDHMHPNYNVFPVAYGGMNAGEYLYRLTNTADQGFGFTFFTGTTIKAGQFFIASEKKPAGAGRLNEVWLDENGNVIEGDATGIETINEAAELNGEVYNLQGVRVENPVKGGIYIKNGKKFVVK